MLVLTLNSSFRFRSSFPGSTFILRRQINVEGSACLGMYDLSALKIFGQFHLERPRIFQHCDRHMSYSIIHGEISWCSSVQIIRQYYLSIKCYADEIDIRFFYRLTLHFKSLFSFKLELNYADFRGQGPSSLVSEGHTSCIQPRRMCSRRESAYTGRSQSKFLRPMWS